MPFYPETRMAL